MNDTEKLPENELIAILNSSTPKEVCNCLAYLFDSENLWFVEQGLNVIDSISTENFSNNEKCMFYYNITNGWSCKERLTYTTPLFNSEYISRQIYYTRLALKNSDNTPKIHKSQIWTNLGNLYSHLGRLSEALNAWNRALEYTPNFGMAIGNMGQCIYKYGGAIFEEKLRRIFLHTSYQLLKQAASLDTSQDDAKMEYNKILKSIESVNKPEIFAKNIIYNDILQNEPENLICYWQWCLSHKLVLNPLNDLITHNSAAYDTLGLPSIHIEGDNRPQSKIDFYFSMFNEIKQQYASARYFIYKGTFRSNTHFSDKNNLLAMKTDYSNYSYNLELMKAGFKQCYSILDKIAYFMNEYLNLGINKKRIYFSSMWEDDKSNIRNVFTDNYNPFFKALYWLSKDLKTSKDKLNPDAEAIAELRNFMEHKSLNIVDYCDSISTTEDKLTLTISREDFENKSISLLALVRSAIIYFLHGIHFRESQKPENTGLYVPMEYMSLDDDWKR